MMTSFDVLQQLKQFIPEIIARFPSIQVLYLFGSHASGTANAKSDVDLAVFTDGYEPPTMDIELGSFLHQALKHPVDVVIMQKVSPILQHEVLRKKIRIFEKEAGVRAFLENQSLRAYLDARYYQIKRAQWRKKDGQNRRNSAAAE
jgi:predicted nucleotidyltransferase